MKYILLFAWVQLLFCNCHTSRTVTHNANSSDTLIRLIAYGRSWPKALKVQSMLSSKWGFYYDCVFGCTISQAEIDSVERINAIAERPLITRYGKNWKEKFGRELTIALATPELICQLFHFDTKVEEKRKELQLQGDTLFYHFKPAKAACTYNVDVVGWQRLGVQKKWVSYFKYYVNYPEYKIKLIRNKIRSDTAYLSNNFYFSEAYFETYYQD
jgi:hypothetical protein